MADKISVDLGGYKFELGIQDQTIIYEYPSCFNGREFDFIRSQYEKNEHPKYYIMSADPC